MDDVLNWLLEPDNPSARYLALTGLLGRLATDPEVVATRAAIPGWGPAKAILDAQWPEGYWMHPGVGYSPRHKATVWQVIFWAQLGAPRIEPIDRACAYVIDHSRLPNGLFSADKTPRGAILCLGGNLLRAFSQLGYRDPRLDESLEALAGAAVGDGFRCRCNASPRPAHHRDGLLCAWGAVKVLGALAELPAEQRTPAMEAAIEAGVALLLNGNLTTGNHPTEPDDLWHKLSFPLGSHSDLVEVLEVLGRLGLGGDPRLASAADVVRSKRDKEGRWALEHTPANTWARFGTVGRPNKWVTLRALRVMREG